MTGVFGHRDSWVDWGSVMNCTFAFSKWMDEYYRAHEAQYDVRPCHQSRDHGNAFDPAENPDCSVCYYHGTAPLFPKSSSASDL